MPVIQTSGYTPSLFFKNGHINTIYPNVFRIVNGINYDRIRINTPDNDFLDLDFSKVNSDVLVLVTHGLEGSSNSLCVKGIVKAINNASWDAVAINLRSCSGEPNLLFSSYHSGKTDDIDHVLDYIISKYSYKKILLTGFSLGGNITLKYAGEKAENVSSIIGGFAGISVPCDLKAASAHLSRVSNRLYLVRFLRTLKEKARFKKQKFPDAPMSASAIEKVKNFYDFDNLYTAPAHGFKDAVDYWEKSSCKNYLQKICIPTLLINAKDDPFIPDSCYPFEEARINPNFYFEAPQYGGHVGFSSGLNQHQELWHETRIIEFFKQFV